VQGEIHSNHLRELVALPALRNLRALTLEKYFDADTLEPILAGSMPKLETLILEVEGSVVTTGHVENSRALAGRRR
jgi:hypothetical protein